MPHAHHGVAKDSTNRLCRLGMDCKRSDSPVLTLQPHHIWLVVVAWDVGAVVDEAQAVLRPGRVDLQAHHPLDSQSYSAGRAAVKGQMVIECSTTHR